MEASTPGDAREGGSQAYPFLMEKLPNLQQLSIFVGLHHGADVHTRRRLTGYAFKENVFILKYLDAQGRPQTQTSYFDCDVAPMIQQGKSDASADKKTLVKTTKIASRDGSQAWGLHISAKYVNSYSPEEVRAVCVVCSLQWVVCEM
jgi:hypothetical protein